MSKELDEKIRKIQDLIDIQCVKGTVDYDPYMQGMANGMLVNAKMTNRIATMGDINHSDRNTYYRQNGKLCLEYCRQ